MFACFGPKIVCLFCSFATTCSLSSRGRQVQCECLTGYSGPQCGSYVPRIVLIVNVVFTANLRATFRGRLIRSQIHGTYSERIGWLWSSRRHVLQRCMFLQSILCYNIYNVCGIIDL